MKSIPLFLSIPAAQYHKANASERFQPLGHLISDAGWDDDSWRNVVWCCCVFPFFWQETPVFNTFRQIRRRELVIFALHAFFPFYRTRISMQDQTLWNCLYDQQNTDVVHVLLKCCSVTLRICSYWQILVKLLWWGKVRLNLKKRGSEKAKFTFILSFWPSKELKVVWIFKRFGESTYLGTFFLLRNGKTPS